MTGSPDGALLVVIDMQRVFEEPDSPWAVPGFDALTAPIERLVEAFGDRVVFTRFVTPAMLSGGWADYYREWSFILEPGAAPLLDLADPWAGHDLPVIAKPTFSAYGAELQEVARNQGAGTLILCGVSTECCVLATALEAADAGMSVHIVQDACASVEAAAHESALRVAEVGFSPIIAITTVEDELDRIG
ncbi:MAG TPA: cysteine hydrolase [Chloroflexota bacterium]